MPFTCPYFSPEVMVKSMRKVTGHFVNCLLKVACIQLDAFLDICAKIFSPQLESEVLKMKRTEYKSV